MAATPLVLCDPTMARWAMRTFFGCSFLDQADARNAGLVAGILCPDISRENGG